MIKSLPNRTSSDFFLSDIAKTSFGCQNSLIGVACILSLVGEVCSLEFETSQENNKNAKPLRTNNFFIRTRFLVRQFTLQDTVQISTDHSKKDNNKKTDESVANIDYHWAWTCTA